MQISGYSINLDLTKLVELSEELKASPEQLNKTITEMLSEIVLYLERQVVRLMNAAGLRDQGTLVDGVTGDVVPIEVGMTEGFVGVEGLASTYVWPIELGSKPHWPPIEELKGWIQRKGIKINNKNGEELSLDSAAFVIGRSIHEHGTIQRFNYGGAEMFHHAMDQSEVEVNGIVDRYIEQFVEKLGG